MHAALAETVPTHLHIVEKTPRLSDRALLAQALEALAIEPDLFIRNGELVEVVTSPTPRIVPLDRYALRERLFASERWQQVLADQQRRTPAWLEMQILKRRDWPGLRPLKGLIHAPMLRPDGSVISRRGYDEATGLYLTQASPLPLPAQPTQADAQKAYRRLVDFAKQLPLQNSTHRAAFIASLLTPMARLAIDGAAPLFLFDAPTDRVPPMLADAVSLIMRGRPVTQLEKPPSERVFRRRLAQAELRDETLILIEGAETYRSGEALKTGLFQRSWVDGDARAEESHPVTWYAAGNNVSLTHEVASLVLPIRTEATEDENGQPLWTPPRAFEKSVLHDRPQLLEAALTLLCAYEAAGRPSQDITLLPRFETWCERIAGAIVWAGGKNPLDSREMLPDCIDDDRVELSALIKAFCTLPTQPQGKTVQELLGWLAIDHPAVEAVREALEVLAPGGGWTVPRKLGALLKKVRGRRVDGLFIARVGEDRKGYARWAACADRRSPPEVIAQGKPLATPPPEPAAESRESIHAADERSLSERPRTPSGSEAG